MTIRPAVDSDLPEIRAMFREYANWLTVDLSFQNFEAELAGLPGDYSPPGGLLLVAEHDGLAAGCVGLRQIEGEICEMKRLFVRAEFRGSGLGRKLVLANLKEARLLGYRFLRLDTLPQMGAAHELYRTLGFREIAPYRYNPVPGTRFLELDFQEFDFKAV